MALTTEEKNKVVAKLKELGNSVLAVATELEQEFSDVEEK